jgi:hypothetical protein
VLGFYPFEDDTVVVTLAADDLKSALERSASVLPPDLRQDEGGAFLQAAGMSYAIDCSGDALLLTPDGKAVQTEGTRIVRIEVAGRVLLDTDAGIDALAGSTVRLVLTSFLTSGLDGHIGFQRGKDAVTIPIPVFDFAQALKMHVELTSPIAPAADGRIEIRGDCGMPQ